MTLLEVRTVLKGIQYQQPDTTREKTKGKLMLLKDFPRATNPSALHQRNLMKEPKCSIAVEEAGINKATVVHSNENI